MRSRIDFRAVLEESLNAYADSNLYLLLDHGGLHGLHNELLKYSIVWESLFEDTKEAGALVVAPIIVLAGDGNRLLIPRRFLEWLDVKAIYASSVILLSSPLPFDCMKERLASRLDAKLAGNIDVMLRFFDPRILGSLVKILTTDQGKKFFGLANSWKYLDRAGGLNAIATVFDSEEKFSPPLVLSQYQEDSLLEASEADQVLDFLRSNFPELTASVALPEQYTFISRQVDVARKLGLNSVLQFSLYAATIWSEGESFVDSEAYSRFLDELKTERL